VILKLNQKVHTDELTVALEMEIGDCSIGDGVGIVMDTKYSPSFIFYVLASYAYRILGAA
jgi:hypothetical protein